MDVSGKPFCRKLGYGLSATCCGLRNERGAPPWRRCRHPDDLPQLVSQASLPSLWTLPYKNKYRRARQGGSLAYRVKSIAERARIHRGSRKGRNFSLNLLRPWRLCVNSFAYSLRYKNEYHKGRKKLTKRIVSGHPPGAVPPPRY